MKYERSKNKNQTNYKINACGKLSPVGVLVLRSCCARLTPTRCSDGSFYLQQVFEYVLDQLKCYRVLARRQKKLSSHYPCADSKCRQINELDGDTHKRIQRPVTDKRRSIKPLTFFRQIYISFMSVYLNRGGYRVSPDMGGVLFLT